MSNSNPYNLRDKKGQFKKKTQGQIVEKIPGSGRKSGGLNKKHLSFHDGLKEIDLDVMAELKKIVDDPFTAKELKVRILLGFLKYMYPQLMAQKIELTVDTQSPALILSELEAINKKLNKKK